MHFQFSLELLKQSNYGAEIMKKQKDVFLTGEGDNWFDRNADSTIRESERKLLPYLQRVNPKTLLEVGCGTGMRLDYLSQHMPECSFWGIDPAEKAAELVHPAYNVLQATADELPFADEKFDVVVIGFCLCVCDVDDFFKIAAEVDRVLVDNGVLVVLDFEPPFEYQNSYTHKEGVWTTKMAFRNMFCWHPSYTLSEMFSYSHDSDFFDPNPNERLSTTIIHKLHGVNCPKNPYVAAV